MYDSGLVVSLKLDTWGQGCLERGSYGPPYRDYVFVLLQTEHYIVVAAGKELRNGVTIHFVPNL